MSGHVARVMTGASPSLRLAIDEVQTLAGPMPVSATASGSQWVSDSHVASTFAPGTLREDVVVTPSWYGSTAAVGGGPSSATGFGVARHATIAGGSELQLKLTSPLSVYLAR